MEIPATGDTGILTNWYILNNANIHTARQAGTPGDFSAGSAQYDLLPVQKICFPRLVQQVKQKAGPGILLVGPGCSWLATQLSCYTDKQVTAINLPAAEIKNARYRNTAITNLQLSAQGIDSRSLADKKFEMIIFCSSLNYFSSAVQIIKKALGHLSLAGEIHICGSVFNELKNNPAQEPRLPFKKYFSHNIDELKAFQYKILYAPSAFINRFSFTKNPFHHIVIKNYYL